MKSKDPKVIDILTKMIVGAMMRIDRLRREKKISNQDIIERGGFSQQRLSNLLNNTDINVTLETIARFSKALQDDILVTPEVYEDKLIRNSTMITELATAVFDNELPEEDKRIFFNSLTNLIDKYSHVISEDGKLSIAPIQGTQDIKIPSRAESFNFKKGGVSYASY